MSKRRKHKSFKKLFLFLGLSIVGIFLYIRYFDYFNSLFHLVTDKKEKDYQSCLLEPVREEENSILTIQMNEISNLILENKYDVSVYYENLTNNIKYTYKADTVYYGCSLIKLVDALYLIQKAIDDEIDLDTETVTYTSNYQADYSSGLSTHSFGDNISLRDLIRYAVALSDNSAHLMLIDYIGFNNLKEYGERLGAKVILTGGDNFGNQTADDTNIYLKEAYRIITENKEYGRFLMEIMDNDDRNDFNTDGIRIYHKYGSYGNNYHDIGLSLEEHPYTISIFTLHENRSHLEVVQSVHAKIRELHYLFYEVREKYCKVKIYGTEDS